MNRAYLSKIPIFLLISVLFFLAIEAAIYEDGIYLYFTKSILKDFDINILNQVVEENRKFLTKTLYFPTHHSLIQSPILAIFYSLESFCRNSLGLNMFREGIVSGFLLHMLSLFIGFKFSNDFVKELGKKTDILIPFLLFFTTSVFYYSFLAVMVIEVFAFPLASFVLLSVAKMKNNKEIQYWALGLCLGLLISSKVYYLGLTAYVFVELFLNLKGMVKKKAFEFFMALLIPIIPALWLHYQQYGEFFFWAGEISNSMSSFTFINVRETLIHGLWDRGGLLSVNPIYIFVFIALVFYSSKLLKEKKTFIEGGFYLAWLFQGFFTTIFIAGALISDQYIGRLVMSILPLLYLGIAIFLEQISWVKKWIIWLFSGVLFTWQLYQSFNYALSIRMDHYLYANQRFMELDDFFKELKRVLWNASYVLSTGPLVFLIVVVGVTFGLLYIERHKEKLEKSFSLVLAYICFFLVGASVLNFLYAEKNIKDYFSVNDIKEVTIGNTPRVYSFIYVTDGLKSQYLGTSDTELRRLNRQKLKEYYQLIQNDFVQVTPEFKVMLEENLKDVERTKYYLSR